MTNTQTNPNTTRTKAMDSKAVLARLMAAENLTVDLNPKASTAYFDLKGRTLTLPLWDVNDETYTMLVGHEVSHALYTPTTWGDVAKSIDPKAPGRAAAYLNVVEDARIERLIKAQYPGLRRSFVEGYRDLQQNVNVFKVQGRDLSKMTFIDRLNVHYKVGFFTPVPFSAEELPLAQRLASTQTFDEVVALTKEIYEFVKEQKRKEQEEKEQEQKPEGQQGEPCEEGEEGEQEGGERSTDEQGDDEGGEEGEEASSGSTGDEEGDGADSDEGEEGEEEASSGSGEGEEGDEEGDEKSSSGSGEGEEAEEGPENAEKATDTTDTGGEGGPDITPDEPETLKAMEEALKSLAKGYSDAAGSIQTIDLPQWDRNMVVPFATVEAVMDSIATQPLATALYGAWKAEESRNVQTLWTEFERRKAADRSRRVMVSETGRLDPVRVVNYKVSDNIFRSNTTVAKGKNHGIVLFLDMSASMNDKIFNTMIQLVNLAEFARRAQIPFMVYGFHETDHRQTLHGKDAGFKDARWKEANKTNTHNGRVSSGGSDLRLYTLLTSGLSLARHQKQVGNLFQWATAVSQGHFHEVAPKAYGNAVSSNGGTNRANFHEYEKAGMGLSNTPTATTLLLAIDLVSEFKAKNGLQVVNTIVMTDGGNNDSPLSKVTTGGDGREVIRPILRDPKTRREYKCFTKYASQYDKTTHTYLLDPRAQQRLLAQVLRDRVGGNVMSVSLVCYKGQANDALTNMARLEGKANDAQWDVVKQNGWACVKTTCEGYSHAALLKIETNHKVITNFGDVVVRDTSKREMNRLGKNFIETLNSKKSNRALMTEIAKVISGQLR